MLRMCILRCEQPGQGSRGSGQLVCQTKGGQTNWFLEDQLITSEILRNKELCAAPRDCGPISGLAQVQSDCPQASTPTGGTCSLKCSGLFGPIKKEYSTLHCKHMDGTSKWFGGLDQEEEVTVELLKKYNVCPFCKELPPHKGVNYDCVKGTDRVPKGNAVPVGGECSLECGNEMKIPFPFDRLKCEQSEHDQSAEFLRNDNKTAINRTNFSKHRFCHGKVNVLHPQYFFQKFLAAS